LPEKKIKNYWLSVLNGKDQHKNEKDDYGDHFSTHLLSPHFFTFISSLGGCHSAANNAGNGLNASFNATEDCGKLKHGVLDPALNLDLKLFDPDRHIMHRFNPIFHSIDLPMNGLHDAFDIPKNQIEVVTDRSYLEAHGIDQFLCFMSCPTDLEKSRYAVDEDQNHACRNDGNTDGQ